MSEFAKEEAWLGSSHLELLRRGRSSGLTIGREGGTPIAPMEEEESSEDEGGGGGAGGGRPKWRESRALKERRKELVMVCFE